MLVASASSLASTVLGGSKSTNPGGVKRGAPSGEQCSETGPNQRLRGVVPYFLSLVGERLGLGGPSCHMT